MRVMTVHKAKGLEFPVVVLADPTCPAARDTPSRHVEPNRRLWVEPLCGSAPIELLEAADEELRRDQAEAVRVAYVATTRARDLLIAPVCGDGPIEGWLDVLKPVLYPPDDSRANSVAADGCPSFGDDSVLDRGPEGVPPTIGSVRPGLHKPLRDGPNVVWWDPSALTLEVEEHAPLRHQRILEVDAAKTTAKRKRARLRGVEKGTDGSADRGPRSPRSRSRRSRRSLAWKPLNNWWLARLLRSRGSSAATASGQAGDASALWSMQC